MLMWAMYSCTRGIVAVWISAVAARCAALGLCCARRHLRDLGLAHSSHLPAPSLRAILQRTRNVHWGGKGRHWRRRGLPRSWENC